jgi:ribosomal protein L30E
MKLIILIIFFIIIIMIKGEKIYLINKLIETNKEESLTRNKITSLLEKNKEIKIKIKEYFENNKIKIKEYFENNNNKMKEYYLFNDHKKERIQILINFQNKINKKEVEEKLQVKVLQYIPDQTFLIMSENMEELYEKSKKYNFWIGHYKKEYKMKQKLDNINKLFMISTNIEMNKKNNLNSLNKLIDIEIITFEIQNRFEEIKIYLKLKYGVNLKFISENKLTLTTPQNLLKEIIIFLMDIEEVHFIDKRMDFKPNNIIAKSMIQNQNSIETSLWNNGITGKNYFFQIF